MPHIHKLYDFVVSAFIVCRGKILLVYHKKYKEWLPIGGHIELNEDPEMALYREIQEECGLKVRILAEAPKIAHSGVKPLPTPAYIDTHKIDKGHRHIAFVYFGTSVSDRAKLLTREHRELKWVSPQDLKKLKPRLTRSIQFYCEKAFLAASRAGAKRKA